MLQLTTQHGVRYHADLLEMIEESLGEHEASSVRHILTCHKLEDVMARLLCAKGTTQTEKDNLVDQVSKAISQIIARQPIEVQDYVLQPLLTASSSRLHNPTPAKEEPVTC
jgi:hypothetical protein